ncbi:MAG: arsenate reductase ArsC [Blastocatellia bacterium]
MKNKQRVLILCTGNSARSQMAEGLLRVIGGGRFDVESAGVEPSIVRPEAIKAMKEIRVDISGHRSKSVSEFAGQHFDHIITVCDNANQTCPAFPGNANRLHHSFEDPPAAGVVDDEESLKIFRRVRDQIKEFLTKFVQEN